MKSEEQIVLKPILPFCTDHTVLVMVRKQVKDRLWTDRLKKVEKHFVSVAVVRIKFNITKRSHIVNYIFRLCYERRTLSLHEESNLRPSNSAL